MPDLLIDKKPIGVPDGSTVLEAARAAGVWIPTLCYSPKLSPSDSCRVCVVEIEGIDGPVTSCNTLATDGMRVCTDSDRLSAMRKEVMRLILMDHPLDCPECPAAGECDIQNLTYKLGILENDLPVMKRGAKVVRDWPLIDYDRNLCIMCQRCVKVCHEVIGASALTMRGVGYDARIDTRDGGPLQCDFCGECVQSCPSGALSNKVSQRWVRSWELRKTPSVCALCSAGCRMELNVKDDRVFRITSDIASHNHGSLCAGGRFGFDLIHSDDRLRRPLLRKDGELTPVSWDEATAFVAAILNSIARDSGPESIAGLASPRLTNEDCYAFQKFFRAVIGSNNIDSEERFNFLRAQKAFELTTGVKGSTNTLEELLQTNTIFVVGTDPLRETPALGWKIKTAARRFDTNVIVANSRATTLDRFANVRLKISPFSESDLALGIMKILLDRELWDHKFVKTKTIRFLAMKGLADKIPMSGIVKRTGVSEDDLAKAALLLAESPNAAIIFGGDVILQENGLQCAMNLANLALLIGAIGRPNSGLYPIVEKGNAIGLCDMGVSPEYLPGYQDMAVARDLFESTWHTTLPYSRGLTVAEMVRGLETGSVRAMYIVGADPVTNYPYSSRISSALDRAELLVVQEMFMSPTAAKAHCVLPAASFAEKEGTITNIEHRIQRLGQAITPPGDARPDWSVLEQVAVAMGQPMGFFSAKDIFREMTLTVPFYGGLSLKDLEPDGVIAHPVTEETRSEGRGTPYSFAPVRTWEKPKSEDEVSYPFELITGSAAYHFGSVSTRSQNLLTLEPEGFVEINPNDASELGLNAGDRAQVTSPVGSFSASVRVSDAVRRSMVFAPTNFPGLGVYGLFQENTTICRVNLAKGGPNEHNPKITGDHFAHR